MEFADFADWIMSNLRLVYVFAIALGGLVFLVRRQIPQLIAFVSLALLAGTLFFAPQVTQQFAGYVAGMVCGGG